MWTCAGLLLLAAAGSVAGSTVGAAFDSLGAAGSCFSGLAALVAVAVAGSWRAAARRVAASLGVVALDVRLARVERVVVDTGSASGGAWPVSTSLLGSVSQAASEGCSNAPGAAAKGCRV